MKPFSSILIFLIVASSCSPSYRLNRLLALHPELKIPDTIVINDTITTAQIEADTFLRFSSIQDNILLQKDKLEITLNRIHDTLYIRGKCKADTIIVQRSIPVEKIKIVNYDKMDNMISKIPWLISGLIAFFGLLIFLIQKFHK